MPHKKILLSGVAALYNDRRGISMILVSGHKLYWAGLSGKIRGISMFV